MGILKNLEPDKVFEYFEEICSIPHGSRDTDKMTDYLVGFAKKFGLRRIRDDRGNVIIFKGASGTNVTEPVILQGHIDMVCEKEDGSDFDFLNDGLKLMIQDGFVTADGTTLGADDGIGVAYMLALLADDTVVHPPLECVFTVDEEIGMLGAEVLDMSVLNGKKMLNIDSEVEGNFVVSCAGGAIAMPSFPIIRRGAQGERCKIVISGLIGGHSGVEVQMGRANSNVLMASLLKELLYLDDSLRIVAVDGGFKDNAFPIKTTAVIVTKNAGLIKDEIDTVFGNIISDYSETDPDIKISFERIATGSEEYEALTDVQKAYPLDEMNNLSFIMAFESLPNGIQAMCPDDTSQVQTSLNLGILNTSDDKIDLSYCVRSSVNSDKEKLLQDIEDITRSAGGEMSVEGVYPGWAYDPDSELTKIMCDTYKEMYGKEAVIEMIHAGVECGFFADRIEGLETISFGPNIYDIHTFREKLDIESTKRVWNYIIEVLKKLS